MTSLKRNSGFTLLEVLIALAILITAFGAIFMVQAGAISATEKARRMNVVAMLAKNKMVEAEMEFEGKDFNEVAAKKNGKFEPPHDDYEWKREIKEMSFPEISASSPAADGEDSSNSSEQADMVSKLVSKFFSQSIREVVVTISWTKGKGTQEYSVSTYWVDLNHEFSFSQ